MKRTDLAWEKDFPIREEVEDFAGKKRTFEITCYERDLGYTVRAIEEPPEKIGYEFAAYSETSPYDALGRLRRKMYRGVATRHITGSSGSYHMTHEKLSGRITCDPDAGMLVVVDGVPLNMDDLARILETHEGFGIEIQIVDALE